MGITFSDPDVDTDQDIVQIAALTPTDNAVIIGNGSAWTAESGATLRTSLGLGIGVDVQGYDPDLAAWAGVNPSSYLTTSAAAAAYQPLDGDLTSWAAVTRASGFDAFAATPTSSNLRALVSDESGSGALLFASGALGTPASGVLTNCTGLPNASVVGLGTAALVNTGTSGATAALNNGANTWSATQTHSATLNMANNIALGTVETGGNIRATVRLNASDVHEFGNANNTAIILSAALRFSGYGAGTLVTDSSGNVSASSDEELKYVTGNFRRGLADLRAMDGPVQYQWKNEQIELAESADTLDETRAKLIEAKAAHVDADDEKRDEALAKVSMVEGALKQKTYLDSLTREQTTYTGWTAQGVRKGIPEAIKAGPDGLLNFDERPVLAAMYNALLEMAARVEALEAAR